MQESNLVSFPRVFLVYTFQCTISSLSSRIPYFGENLSKKNFNAHKNQEKQGVYSIFKGIGLARTSIGVVLTLVYSLSSFLILIPNNLI